MNVLLPTEIVYKTDDGLYYRRFEKALFHQSHKGYGFIKKHDEVGPLSAWLRLGYKYLERVQHFF